MVRCDGEFTEDNDYICGFGHGENACFSHHCDFCEIGVCTPDCDDEYCARTKKPSSDEMNECMLCAYPMQEGEEWNQDENDWFKDGKRIQWNAWNEFSYPEDYEAEDSLKFKEWAKQEMKTHGDDEDFDDWLYDEMGSHGDNVTLQDWGHHELDSHYERYGAEEYDHVKAMREFVAWLKKNNLEPSDVKGFTPDGHVILKPITQRANYKPDVMFSAEGKCDLFCNGKNDRDKGSLFCVPCMEEWGERMKKNKDFQRDYNPPEDYYRAEELKRDSCCCGATKSKPCACMILGVMECNATCPCALEKERNWGGDSQGQLATALRNARIKGKEPKKPLKIEKLDAEEGGFYELEVLTPDKGFELRYKTHNEEDATNAYHQIHLLYPQVVLLEVDSDGMRDVLYRQRNEAETSGQWEIGEQLEEAQMNAEFLYYYVLNEKGEQPANFDTLEEAQAYVANSSEPLEIYERRSRNDESHKMDKKMKGYEAEPYDNMYGPSRTPEQQAILDERKRKLDYRLSLGKKYPRKCTFCLAGIHEGLEDGSLTQEEFDTYMNDPMFPTPTGCERHDYWIAEEEYYHPDGEYDDGGGEMGCGPCQWYGDYDIGMAPAAEHTCIECEEGVCDGCYDSKTEMCLECAHDKATVKEAPKGIDTFTEPFEESSLDSGTAKSIVVGIGIGLLACFGYNKWK